MCFSKLPLYLLHLSIFLIGWGHDQEVAGLNIPCLQFYVLFSPFGDTIQLCDSDGQLCQNSLLVFP